MPPAIEPVLIEAGDIPYPLPDLGAIGVYELLFATALVDAEAIAPFLPAGLELMPPPGCPHGKHVVVLTAGSQSGVVPMYAEWMPALNYQEFIYSIPYVRMTNVTNSYTEPFAHPLRIYVTSAMAWLYGRMAGYPKQMCDACDLTRDPETGTGSLSLRKSGASLIRGTFEPTEQAMRPPLEFRPFDERVNPILHQPINGSLFGGVLQNIIPGLFLDSYFEWKLGESKMQAVCGEWNVEGVEIPGLPPGAYKFDGYDSNWIGMGYMRAPWAVRGLIPRSALEIAWERAESRARQQPRAAGVGS